MLPLIARKVSRSTIWYLEQGMNVANVGYRLAETTLAPAAVEDARCAIRWVFKNAAQYGIDPEKVVVAGHSAGGHLALMTAMVTAEDGFDNECPGGPWRGNNIFQPDDSDLRVAAVINFYGIVDVEDMVIGPNQRTYAIRWFGFKRDAELARRVSPISHIRSGLPPVVSVHGTADDVVPFAHAERLHRALTEAGVANQLIPIREAPHLYWFFKPDDLHKAYTAVFDFLRAHGILDN